MVMRADTSVCMCVCVYALRIVYTDKIFRFINTFIISSSMSLFTVHLTPTDNSSTFPQRNPKTACTVWTQQRRENDEIPNTCLIHCCNTQSHMFWSYIQALKWLKERYLLGQHANFRGNPIHQATKRLLNNS